MNRLLLLSTLLLAACADIPYYWQAGMGQMEILAKRRPIAEVLADGETAQETRRKLRLILEVQAFASSRLALPEEGHYRYYADLKRPYVSWVVVAAQPLALREHRFCYPVVGCLGYRGYFSESKAHAYADRLRDRELDVMVRPVRAYSTLGWFDDPVLNTLLAGEDTELIDTVFHEQAHRRYFLEGETAFNESFASFVGRRGLRLYLESRSETGAAMLRRYDRIRRDRERFRSIVMRGRARLEALYASHAGEREKRAEKARLFERMRQDYQNERKSFNILNYDGWFSRPLNNAHLVGFAHYNRYLKAFLALFEEQGSDFARFYRGVEELGALPRAEREAALNRLENQVVAKY